MNIPMSAEIATGSTSSLNSFEFGFNPFKKLTRRLQKTKKRIWLNLKDKLLPAQKPTPAKEPYIKTETSIRDLPDDLIYEIMKHSTFDNANFLARFRMLDPTDSYRYHDANLLGDDDKLFLIDQIFDENGYMRDIQQLLMNPTWKQNLNLILIGASFYGHVSAVKEVLAAKKFNWDELTKCLILAFMNGHSQVVEALFQAALDNSLTSPAKLLQAASVYGTLSTLKMILPRILDINILHRGYIKSSKNGNVQALDAYLQDPRIDPAYSNNAALIAAIKDHRESSVLKLLNDGRINPAIDHQFALTVAFESNNLPAIHALIRDPRIDPSANENLVLRWASATGSIDIISQLVKDHRVDPSFPDNLPLKLAVYHRKFRATEILLLNRRVIPSSALYLASDEKIKGRLRFEISVRRLLGIPA
jgi:hypothetical protein